ncbi:hypothetical protein F511_27726 [Dorcoceras hygrometricum]|uniref:Glycosyltransferase family 28 N-terminal domain-containing protein n=1 Tax=Dorcoceras hygrometricum TaxID=472368 RepID=A0A2Z7CN29_9LAMI|nr:hypothetical protein F511_27726 [Dorcoceras hygrometricum]
MATDAAATTSLSSGEVSMQDISDVAAPQASSGSAAPYSDGGSYSSGIAGATITRVNTTPSVMFNSERFGPSSDKVKIERSKTERQSQINVLPKEAAQFFDDRTSDQQKLILLKRIATVKDDGTVEFEVPKDIEPQTVVTGSDNVFSEVDDELIDEAELQYIPPLQIVMLIVGTRGDVQPFIAIGKKLQDYGHRVRLATHSNFKEFVLTSGLEFHPLGGDPKVLAEYMVKNKGFLPSGPSEVPVQRKQMKEIIYSLLNACKDPDIDSGIPFKAEAIIANPPAYG